MKSSMHIMQLVGVFEGLADTVDEELGIMT